MIEQVQAGSKTSCKIVNQRITLMLPTTTEEGYRYAQTSVGTDFSKLFEEDVVEQKQATTVVPSIEPDDDPEWDTINIVSVKTPTPSARHDEKASTKFQDIASLKPRPLPKLKSLQRPEVLFNDLLPVFLTVKGNEREIFIEGSHAPTISLIAEYFKNYARRDMYDAVQVR